MKCVQGADGGTGFEQKICLAIYSCWLRIERCTFLVVLSLTWKKTLLLFIFTVEDKWYTFEYRNNRRLPCYKFRSGRVGVFGPLWYWAWAFLEKKNKNPGREKQPIGLIFLFSMYMAFGLVLFVAPVFTVLLIKKKYFHSFILSCFLLRCKHL